MLYDNIGTGYSRYRRPDPRIAAAVTAALGRSATVVNVGAGAGSYEPSDRVVVAVEPSVTMIRQRAPGTAPVVQASALHLPFRDKSFAAALAVLTVHHWADRRRGLSELVRAARDRIVIVTFEPAAAGFWLVDEYFPAVRDVIRRSLPALDEIREVLGSVQVHPLLIPHDCTDGFLCAYWRRPEAYLDAGVRRAISAFANVSAADAGIERLRRDLQDGTWYQRHRDLVTKDSLDLGYRLIVAEPVPEAVAAGPA